MKKILAILALMIMTAILASCNEMKEGSEAEERGENAQVEAAETMEAPMADKAEAPMVETKEAPVK